MAQELIKKSGVPIAAPSANKFGHVSPTKPTHVLGDFVNDDVLIIDGGPCSFGIESTVLKLIQEKEDKHYLLSILRKGGVSQDSLEKTVIASSLGKELALRVEAKDHVIKPAHKGDPLAPLEAPGMLLKHYSPRVDAYIIQDLGKSPVPLPHCAMVDFAQIHLAAKDKVRWYRDLSAKGDVKEAISNIYEFLREAETQDEVKAILLADMRASTVLQKVTVSKEHAEALYDRMFRAAAGRILDK